MIQDRDAERIAGIVYERSGIYLQRKDWLKIKKFLEQKIASGEVKTAEDLIQKLKSSRKLLNDLLDAVTINETYFFRHKSQFDVIEKELLPKLFKEKPSVKMWSAACSTGEEPYTMAIVAKLVMERMGVRKFVKIVANDVSQEAIDKAKEGIYNRYSVRYVPKEILSKFFTKTPDGKYAISEEIKKMVDFRLLSITDERDMRSIGNRVDIAMCRNVLIYFDTESKRKALKLITENLLVGGYLFLGPSESARGVVENLKVVLFPGAIAYTRVK